MRKHFRNQKKKGLSAVEVNPESFYYLGKNLTDAEDIFNLDVKIKEMRIGYASQRLKKSSSNAKSKIKGRRTICCQIMYMKLKNYILKRFY